jgi:hypothetical protein
VVYDGVSGVKTLGVKTFRIPVDRVKELVDEFDKAGFFTLEDRYTSKRLDDGRIQTVDHANATTISLRIGERVKSIYDFYGGPETLKELERKIDEAAKARQFVGRT